MEAGKIDTSNQNLTAKRKELFIKALRGRAGIYYHIGEYDKGIRDYKNLINFCERKSCKESTILQEIIIDYALLLSEGQSEYKNAETMIKSSLKRIDRNSNPKMYARVLTILGNINLHRGSNDDALKYYQKALNIWEKLEIKEKVGSVCGNIGLIHWIKGELDEALNFYKKDLEISKEIGDKKRTGIVSCNIGNVYFNKGELDDAIRFYRKHLEISEYIGYKRGISNALNNIGLVYDSKGELDEALNFYERDLKISKELGDKRGIGMACSNMGNIYFNKGELDKAIKFYLRYLNISEDIGYKMGIANACNNLGLVSIESGKYYEAEIFLKRAEGIFKEIGEKINSSGTYIGLSELEIIKGNQKTAIEFARKSLEFAKETGAKEQELSALCAIGKALVYTKDEEKIKEGISYIEKSISIGRKEKMHVELAKSLYELGKIMRDYDKGKSVKYLKEAEVIFKKMGAKIWMRKTEDLLSSIE